ncbi:MAG: hypothetical protein ACK4S6_00740 [Roseateles asaccharophilus]|uniref:hypothetical protein n=1 Tax=Roseateles asaccharophilus TaxID=582607 RepID=UPI0010620A1F|nr:hypothetical protein [Roseateles asaccharophilus]MDN3545580.1 hypothetical protein [Roseateles asaccharophilus]
MATNPTHDELMVAIKDGFVYFKQQVPTVTFEPVGPCHKNSYVKGAAENEWCWVSIDEQAIDERIPNSARFLGAVSTRGDDLFAAVVVYSICKKFGNSVYDDAGYLNSGKEFTIAEFEEALRARLDSCI